MREEIKNSRDKFSASEKIGELKAEKSKLAGKLKKLSEQNPFLKLNTEEKSALCLSVLLQKYLTNELEIHPELLYGRNEKGAVTVNVEALRSSELFRQVQQIHDYVTAYIGNYAEKVISPGYFITLLGNNKNWRNLYDTAETYFEKQRHFPQNVTALDFVNLTGAVARTLKPERYIQLKHLVMKFYSGAGFYANPVDNGLDWKELPVPRNIEELYCHQLRLNNAETLDLSRFDKLGTIDIMTLKADNLKRISLPRSCKRLVAAMIEAPELQEWNLAECGKLNNVELVGGNIGKVTELKLPASLQKLNLGEVKMPDLKTLDLSRCHMTERLMLHVFSAPKLEQVSCPDVLKTWCGWGISFRRGQR